MLTLGFGYLFFWEVQNALWHGVSPIDILKYFSIINIMGILTALYCDIQMIRWIFSHRTKEIPMLMHRADEWITEKIDEEDDK